MLFAFPWSSLVEGDEQTENSPNVKQEWNVAIHVLQIFLGGGVINTTAYHLGLYSLHLLLLKMAKLLEVTLLQKHCT